MKNNSTAFRICIVGSALVTAGLQVALGWSLYAQASPEPKPSQYHTSFLSGTVCQNELIVLTDTHPEDNVINQWIEKTCVVDEVHCDLQTGRVLTFPALPGVRHVVSDGQSLWRLPHHDRVRHPIVWCGRPVDPTVSSYHKPLLEFTDGDWRETEEYLLMPYGYPCFPPASPLPGSTSIPMLKYIRNQSNMLYNADVIVGTKQQAMELHQRRHSDRNPLFDLGWKETNFDSTAFPRLFMPSNLSDVALGLWFEGSQVCALNSISEDGRIAGFEFHLSAANQGDKATLVRSPIRWGSHRHWRRLHPGWINVVPTSSGDVFILSFNADDRRLHVLKWKDGSLRLVGQRGSPLLGQECRVVETFVRYAILIPMFVLSLMVWLIQCFEGPREFCFGHDCVRLASGVRRGIARMIDLSIPLTILIASAVLHPDVVGWWFEVKSKWWSLIAPCFKPSSASFPKSLGEFANNFLKFYWELISVPSLIWLSWTAILIIAAQIIWQGRTGRTLGKWLMGVRVLRTTLRTCGIARSLLREILLIVDSMMLLSWIPGTISILATNHSQRIGDRFADTIVVRDPPHRPAPLAA